jgi:hypothetical protein
MADLTLEEARERELKWPQTILLRPPVTFTEEQKAKIRQMMDEELGVEEARANALEG